MAERLLAWPIMLPEGSVLLFCSGHWPSRDREQGGRVLLLCIFFIFYNTSPIKTLNKIANISSM